MSRFAEARRRVLDDRAALARAAARYYGRVFSGLVPVLMPGPGIAPPIAIDAVRLVHRDATAPDWERHREAVGDLFDPRPPRVGYAEAIAEHEPHRSLWNGAAYRLVDVSARADGLELGFSAGCYFDGLDTGEILAHELAARPDDLALRALHPDPFDLSTRSTGLAVSAVTIVRRPPGARFYMVRRADSVAVAPGMVHVVPAGEFQPRVAEGIDFGGADFDVVALVERELSEELGGVAEEASRAEHLAGHIASGGAALWTWGVTIDALNLKPELLCALVLDEPTFDHLVGEVVVDGVEGRVLVGDDGLGLRFDEARVERFVGDPATVPFAAATLALAWRDRDVIF